MSDPAERDTVGAWLLAALLAAVGLAIVYCFRTRGLI